MRAFGLVLLCAPALAQSFNIDVGENSASCPVPADAYGAAALQPGRWTSCSSPFSTTLLNLDGTLSSVTASSNNPDSYTYLPSGLTGDDYNLMVDLQNLQPSPIAHIWTFSGLANGDYRLFTYAYAPEYLGFMTFVSVPGSINTLQEVGGYWSGGPHVLGVTYARHQITVSGGTLDVFVQAASGWGSINGFQLVHSASPVAYCFGDGTSTPCPCGNSGAPGRGCRNSVVAVGGQLEWLGWASISADTCRLSGQGMPNESALYFQGTQQQSGGFGSAFGDGLRCAGGTLVRLAVRMNSGGASMYPYSGDPSISVRGGCSPGDVRTYQILYRNAAAYCTPATFNLTNAVQIQWSV